MGDIDCDSDMEFTFIPVEPAHDNVGISIDPFVSKNILFVPLPPARAQASDDNYLQGKESVPIITSQQRTRTNKHSSSCTPRPVSPIHISPPKTVNDVKLLPLIVVPLTDDRDRMSNELVNTAEVDVFTQEIYLDALHDIDNAFDLYGDGSDIMAFGQ